MLRKWNFSSGSFINLQNNLQQEPSALVKKKRPVLHSSHRVEDKMLDQQNTWGDKYRRLILVFTLTHNFAYMIQVLKILVLVKMEEYFPKFHINICLRGLLLHKYCNKKKRQAFTATLHLLSTSGNKSIFQVSKSAQSQTVFLKKKSSF